MGGNTNKVFALTEIQSYNKRYRMGRYLTIVRGRRVLFSNQALKKLIIPLVIEQVLVMLVGMADTAMVSYAGEAAISGVALVDMFCYMIITILTAVATGGAVIVSQFLGSGDRTKANLSASQLLVITFLISSVIMAVCTVFHHGILKLFFGSIEADVMEAAATYLVITAFSFPFLGIYNSSAALFRSMGKTNVTMYVSLLMNAINVAGNAVGIFVFHAGVAGVAVPTLISRIVAGILMSALAFRESNTVFVRWKDICRWDRETIRRILRIAVPNGIENGLFALGRVLVTSIVALFGTVQIAANGVANSVDMIAIVVVNAVNLAMVTVVGQCVGADEYEQAKAYTWKLMKISYLATAVLGVLVCVSLPLILQIYELSDQTYRLSCFLIIMHNILAILLHQTSFNLSNSLRAAGDAKFTMYVGVGSMIVFRLGTAVLFGMVLNLGIIGVWIAMGMDWLARSVAFVIRYKSGKWKEYKAIN